MKSNFAFCKADPRSIKRPTVYFSDSNALGTPRGPRHAVCHRVGSPSVGEVMFHTIDTTLMYFNYKLKSTIYGPTTSEACTHTRRHVLTLGRVHGGMVACTHTRRHVLTLGGSPIPPCTMSPPVPTGRRLAVCLCEGKRPVNATRQPKPGLVALLHSR